VSRGVEILCPQCGEESFLRREPVYDGFRKTGEKLTCAACGHRFESESEVPFKGAKGPGVFGPADRSRKPDLFAGDEVRNCRRCEHYVVNPFVQRCVLHGRTVEATDGCADFAAKRPAEEGGAADPS